MEFDFRQLSQKDRYKLMVSTIVPRPIALATSIDADGKVNAAPYSFFNGMASDPPILVIGIELDFDHELKHTGHNIRRTGEFVVNLVNEDLAQQMVDCAIDFPRGVDEVQATGLTALPSVVVAPPRIAESPVSFECRKTVSVEVGAGRMIVVGEIQYMHIRDDLIANEEKLYIATEKAGFIGRMHGTGWYARTTDLFEVRRQSFGQWQERNPDAAAALGTEPEAAD